MSDKATSRPMTIGDLRRIDFFTEAGMEAGHDIVRAVNAYDDLLEALKRALAYIERDETAHDRKFGEGNVVRAALAKAEGK